MAKAKKAAASGGTKAIADVAHPGTSAPADTSKPIITHRPMVKDPMVVEEDSKPEEPTPFINKTSEVTITPPNETVATDDPAPAETEPATAEEPKTADTDKESPPPDQDAKVQKLIDSKKYFLPINAVEQRRSKRVVTLGIVLAVLLALAWVNIALDAGIIHLDNIKPLTHFFSN